MNIVNILKKKILEYHKQILLFACVIFFITFFIAYSEKSFDWVLDKGDADNIIVLENEKTYSVVVDVTSGHRIEGFSLKFGTFGRVNEGDLCVKFLTNDEVIKEFSLPASMLKDNEYFKFDLDKLIVADSNIIYSIEITESYSGENYVALYTESENGDISYSITYRKLKIKIIITSVCIVMMLIVAILLAKSAKDTTIMLVVLGFLLAMFLYIIPLGRTPDERNHFLRAYEIANVSMISEHIGENGEGGNYLPTNIDNWTNEDELLNLDQVSAFTFGTMSLYAPVSYLPQSLGIKIAGLFTQNISRIYFSGRLANAICSFILCSLALIIIPFGKRTTFIIMTFPMTLQEMVSMSPDGLTISLSLFFLAYVLKCANSEKQITKRDIVIILLSGLVLSLCKIVYVIILPAIFIISLKSYKSKKVGVCVRGGLLGVGTILNLIWLKISSGFLIEFQPGVDSGQQVKGILLNPFRYCGVILNTLRLTHVWIKEMIGESLGIYEAPIIPIVWIGILIILIYEIDNDCVNDLKISEKRFVIFLILFVLGVVLIMTSLYVQWTTYMNRTINGIQGRYFTPLLLLLLLPILVFKKNEKKDGGCYCSLPILLLNSITIADVCNKFINTL